MQPRLALIMSWLEDATEEEGNRTRNRHRDAPQNCTLCERKTSPRRRESECSLFQKKRLNALCISFRLTWALYWKFWRTASCCFLLPCQLKSVNISSSVHLSQIGFDGHAHTHTYTCIFTSNSSDNTSHDVWKWKLNRACWSCCHKLWIQSRPACAKLYRYAVDYSLD